MKNVLFITTQFLTEKTNHGGIGNYIFKMSKALMERGHHVEVLVTSTKNNGTITFEGIKVHRVYIDHFLNKVFRKTGNWPLLQTLSLLADKLYVSWLVRKKFRKLNKKHSCDIVQVPNYQTPGLFIKRSSFYSLYNRISSNRLLYDTAENGSVTLMSKIENSLDLIQAKKSDVVYTPSEYLANYLHNIHGLDADVLYPPAELGVTGLEELSIKLPPRYMIHYGYLSRRKGTDIVAEALRNALVEQPGIQMVFAGKMNRKMKYLKEKEFWGEYRKNVHFIGFLEKKKIYSLVKGAQIAVLPSRVDNFPNTVIESLSLGTPVIGTYESSIGEIVKPGVNGVLVENGNVKELSAALIDVWNEGYSIREQEINDSLQRFNAEKSVCDFIAISGSQRSFNKENKSD